MAGHKLRIIAGRYRGRTLLFNEAEGLRPTPDRIRETLFNWLQPVITGARCLDMFAGSGLLGIEALSRGASQVVFIESQKPALEQLRSNLDRLGEEKAMLLFGDAFAQVQTINQAFDIIFLDPPFHQGLLARAMSQLASSGLLTPAARVYLESEYEITDAQIPAGWEIIRAKKAGQVFYHLAVTT
ncbi:16S rRNA (guanine(966)-N(2))-methyltransferase RsmD [Kaarinaea lacus]